ncbi:MAG: hypothetical protein RL748_285 [Pseudomonadota bacterium]
MVTARRCWLARLPFLMCKYIYITMMQRFWLLFAQTITVGLALWFILSTLKPEWLPNGGKGRHAPVVTTQLGSSRAVSIQESPATGPQGSVSYRDAAKLAMPSVVNISSTKHARVANNPLAQDPFFRRFFGQQDNKRAEKQFNLGSGVIVSAQGYILTNNHVVDGAEEIEVALTDGRKASATIVGTDPDTDLAVIHIKLNNLPAITFGHSETAQVGDVVLAIGNPFEVGQTVTMGIISATGRNHLGLNQYENFIQTDAAINPGNSGGALVDTKGNLLGINSAIYSKSGGSMGIGFAIPVSSARQVMEAIIQHGSVTRGWIGVEPQEITPELAESFGLAQKMGSLVAGVLRNGPADKGGMRPGDILLKIDGKAVADTTEMLNLIAQLRPGDKVRFVVLRKNQETALDLVVGKRPKRNEPVDEPQ